MVETPKMQGCTRGHTQLSSTFIPTTQVEHQSRKTGQFWGCWNNIQFEQGMGRIPAWEACERNGRVRNRRWNNPACFGEVFKTVPRAHQEPRAAGESENVPVQSLAALVCPTCHKHQLMIPVKLVFSSTEQLRTGPGEVKWLSEILKPGVKFFHEVSYLLIGSHHKSNPSAAVSEISQSLPWDQPK